MKTKQAKDFLVQQVTQQASQENIPLSDLERKMMYFTESDPASCENPAEINDEFEAKYDTAEYELKISRLLHHAYDRLKSETPAGKRNWDDAIRTLRRGDHYVLVLWDITARERPKSDSLRILRTALVIVAALMLLVFWAEKYNVDLDRHHNVLFVVVLVVILGIAGGFRLLYQLALAWFHRGTTNDDESN